MNDQGQQPDVTPANEQPVRASVGAAWSDELLLGVDAGGTKTAAWLARSLVAPDGRRGALHVLGRGVSGAGNPRAAGFDTATRHFDQAIEQAFTVAGCARVTVAAACLGVSGAGRAEEQQALRDWAHRKAVARTIYVTHDAEPVLAAMGDDNETGGGPAAGIVLISGTGSFAWGRNRAGQVARSGGWGYLVGDEGSAYAVALDAIRAVLRAVDGRGPETRLLPAVLEHARVDEPSELVGWLYDPMRQRDEIAAFAPRVFEFVEQDAIATEIVARAAHSLAELVLSLGHRLQLDDADRQLALTGGMLLSQSVLRMRLQTELNGAGWYAKKSQVVTDPVFGCLQIAAAMART